MTTQETASLGGATAVAVYHGPPVSDRREELERGLAEGGIPAAAVRPLDEYGGVETRTEPGEVALVFSDRVPEATIDRPTVWVTADAGVMEAVGDRALDVIHWELADDWDVLEARLGRTLDRLTGPTGGFETTARVDNADTDPSLYEYLVETVGDAVYILDDEGRFVFVNDALCEMTGFEREELLGSSVHIIKDEPTVLEAEDALRELLRERTAEDSDDGVSIAKLDVDLLTADGERVPATDRMTLRPLEDGEFTGTVGTLRDISRQRRRQNILSGIIETTREMMAATDESEVAELVTDAAGEVFDLDLASVRKYHPETDQLRLLTESDAAADLLGEAPAYDPDEGPVGTAFTEDRIVVREGAIGTRRDTDAVAVGAYCPIGDRHVLSFGRQEGSFADDELRLIEVLANTAAAAFDRVRREENLRQYEAIVEAADDTLFTVDEDCTFTLVTRPFARLLGHRRTDLIGRRLDEVLADPGAIEAATASDDPVETTLLRHDGGEIPARLALAPFEGSFERGLVGTVRDISQLKSARQEASRQRRRFTELFETLDDPVADIVYEDGVATVESVNPAFDALCDATAATVQGSTLAATQGVLPEAVADALEAARSPGSTLDTAVTAQTDDGEGHYLVRTVPYDGDDAKRAFVLLTDVTEVKRRGTHLKVLHRLLRHDLRNETTLIRGYAERLQSLDTRPEVDDHAARIVEASDELVAASETSRTVQRVLGMEEEAIDPAPIGTVVERVREALDTDSVVDLAVGDVSGRVPFSHYLVVALSELVDNAVEHGDAGAVGVEVADAAEAPEADVRLAVSDDGPGLPREQWQILHGDREITQLQHGNGLGLWLVKWVTDRHNGRLRLDQADDDGTTVSILLPTVEA